MMLAAFTADRDQQAQPKFRLAVNFLEFVLAYPKSEGLANIKERVKARIPLLNQVKRAVVGDGNLVYTIPILYRVD